RSPGAALTATWPCDRGRSYLGRALRLAAEEDDAVGRNVVLLHGLTVWVANNELTHARRRAESEVHSRVLRRQIARPCLHLAYQPATVREDRSHNRSGREPGEPYREPVADCSGRAQKLQLPSNRIDGYVHAAVVVE